jgi:N-dimethylarginine dimethylaminohydrolase
LISDLDTTLIVPCNHQDELYDEGCVGNKDTLALTEVTPAFDAANALRANDDILYLVSNSGNVAGANLLQEMLGDRAKVHLLENVYAYMHIDSTIAFLREGLMLLNPERIKSVDVLPEPFRSWDVIWCPDAVDIGYHPGYNHGSCWVANMNLFSVNPNLVVLEKHQELTRKELEKHGIECAMLPMRHQRTLSGGFHCVTLDLERE